MAPNGEIRARVLTRTHGAELGNLGDRKGIAKGISELRLDFGPEYRVDYGLDSASLVILLVGGTERRQSHDIELAQAYWKASQQEKRKCR